MKTIQTAFATTNQTQLTAAQLIASGATQRSIDRAVADEKLRKGVTGYWLPQAPDPGAVAVMRAAMHDSDADDDSN